jgi:hypothetical protein
MEGSRKGDQGSSCTVARADDDDDDDGIRNEINGHQFLTVIP